MTTTKNLGIWMDHASAHVMEFADPITNIVVCESTNEEKKKTLQKGVSMMQNKNQQQQEEYYKKVGQVYKRV